MEQIKIADIRLDGGTQPRAFIDTPTVAEYADLLTDGVVLPPVTLYYDGTDYWPADGFHRIAAARKNAFLTIDAEVIQGTLEDAQWHSFGANKTHGLRRTNQDKQRAVEAALKHPLAASKSTAEIAEHCGVSRDTIKRYREPIMANRHDTGTRTVTRQGTTFTMQTAKIGKKKPAPKAVLPTVPAHPPLSERATAQLVESVHDPAPPTQATVEAFRAVVEHRQDEQPSPALLAAQEIARTMRDRTTTDEEIESWAQIILAHTE